MEAVSGNIYIRPNGPFEAGQSVPGHKHHFDHTTICFHGSFRVVKLFPDGGRQELLLEGPRPTPVGSGTPDGRISHVLIEAGIEHEFTALETGSIFWCVYSHRSPQGDVIQVCEGFDRAYGITAA